MKKKNTFIRVLALSLCAIVLCLSLASCAGSDKVKSGFGEIWEGTKEGAQDIYNKVTDDSTGDVDITFNNSEYISLCSAEVATLSTDGSTVTQKLVATVSPSFALDKSVDWDIYWITKPDGASDDVTDYADVAPESGYGDTTAWFTLYHFPFGAEIGVRATTRVGGYSAECVVKCLGVPTSAELEWEIYKREDISVDKTFYTHGEFVDGLMDEYKYLDNYDTIEVHFDLKCDNNPDGRVVGSQYNDYSFTFDGVDGEVLFYLVSPAMGNMLTTCTKDRNPELFQKISEDMQQGIDEGVFLSQGYLNVMPGWFVPGYGHSYKVQTTQDGGATYVESTYLYDAGCDLSGLRFNFTVTENVSGFSFSFALRFDNAPVEPASVSLDTTEIVY